MQKKEDRLSDLLVVLFVEVSFCDRCQRGKRIPLPWNTVRELALAKGFCFNTGNMKYVCLQKNEACPPSSSFFTFFLSQPCTYNVLACTFLFVFFLLCLVSLYDCLRVNC